MDIKGETKSGRKKTVYQEVIGGGKHKLEEPKQNLRQIGGGKGNHVRSHGKFVREKKNMSKRKVTNS